MTEDETRATFILRLNRDALGQISGVIERVRTGEKRRVGALEDISTVLQTMLRETEASSSGPTTSR